MLGLYTEFEPKLSATGVPIIFHNVEIITGTANESVSMNLNSYFLTTFS